MEIITKLRVPKIQIIQNLELSIFDITASYLGVYFISKYIFNVSRPALTSAIIFLPISYFTHEYFEIETPFNNYINGKTKPDVKLVEAPFDNNMQIQPTSKDQKNNEQK